MSRYQVALSLICLLASTIGVYAIAHNVIGQSAPTAWALSCLLICLALIVTRKIERLPVGHEAILRAANARQWPELSRFHRNCMMIFDWPLFRAVRDREVQRLVDEPLVRVTGDATGITLQPIELQHLERYFLRAITSAGAQHGLKVQDTESGLGISNPKYAGKIRLAGGDERIIQHVCDKFAHGELVSLRCFADAVEVGYLSTLPEKERYAYMMAMR